MGKMVIYIYGVAFRLNQYGTPILPNIINKLFVRLLFSCQIGLGAKIGKGVNLGYGGLGIVIHKDAVIGKNVRIGAGVTIGGTTKQPVVPVIGENSLISTGAKVLGPIVIGNNCVIGANAVVLIDIPDNCVAVGVPAKIIKRNIDISDYRDTEFLE